MYTPLFLALGRRAARDGRPKFRHAAAYSIHATNPIKKGQNSNTFSFLADLKDPAKYDFSLQRGGWGRERVGKKIALRGVT